VADRARAAGLAARRCDGADVIGVTAAMGHAIARARSGAGPSLVEIVVTPQLHDPPAARDPIERLRRLLDLQGLWSPTYQDVLEADLRGASERAFAAAAAAAPGGSDARGPQ
jgi:TPP-dependent pyruvate/acetoin dehydrogenase alpha subunit